MHVGIDARMMGPERYGGIGRYLSNLVEHLPEEQAVRYTFFVNGNRGEVFSYNDCKAVSLHIPVYSLREQVLLPLKLTRSDLELLHSPHYNAPLLAPCPQVVTVQDLTHLKFPSSRKAYWYARLMLPLVCRRARCIITPSRATADDLGRLIHVDAGKVHVVPYGVEDRFRPAEPNFVGVYRAFCGLPPAFILYVGGTRPYKDLPRLLQAFALVRRQGVAPDCKLLIVSHELPPKDPRVMPALRHLELEGKVLLQGPVSDRELPLLYNAATVLAFPSRNEGFGFPPLEAMACGTPVVCSDSGSLPEVVGDGAVVVREEGPESLAEALRRVLTDRELRQELRARGIRQAGQFSWHISARRTFEVYRHALRGQAIS